MEQSQEKQPIGKVVFELSGKEGLKIEPYKGTKIEVKQGHSYLLKWGDAEIAVIKIGEWGITEPIEILAKEGMKFVKNKSLIVCEVIELEK